ncbi:phosphoglycerate mutase-like protein [Rhizopogon salebrosus TDB-379]|nr:phosphoglycerate mutase-like protein [Rhizopogon salebrosus TDB-379]
MYIQSFLNWLPLAYLTFDSYKHEHEPPNELGNLSPYHVAPAFPIEAELPGDCTVDRVMLMHRHGSRGPANTDEEDSLNSLVRTLREGHTAIQRAYLPENLRFLKKGYDLHLEPQNLTIIGRQQLFNHGVEFGMKYPNFTTDTLLSSYSQRVIDSMYFFAQGRFGREVEDKKLLTVNDMHDPASWITPWTSCPELDMSYGSEVSAEWSSIYLPPITDRLNALLPGVFLVDDDTHGALYACAYDLAAGNEAPWCNVFYPHEFAAFDYELDLIMDASVGYLAVNNSGRVLGSVFVNKLIERFSNVSEEAQSLYLEFGHDTTIMPVLAAMNLNRDYPPLSPHGPPLPRKFRSSYQTPFAANMIWERFTCKMSFHGPQIRLVLNGQTYPLLPCAKTMQHRKYGTCSLEAFIEANEFSTSIRFGDDTWKGVCGAGAHSEDVRGEFFST